eukprot:21024-Eustigmatos_ZCMA.PRE.1
MCAWRASASVAVSLRVCEVCVTVCVSLRVSTRSCRPRLRAVVRSRLDPLCPGLYRAAHRRDAALHAQCRHRRRHSRAALHPRLHAVRWTSGVYQAVL